MSFFLSVPFSTPDEQPPPPVTHKAPHHPNPYAYYPTNIYNTAAQHHNTPTTNTHQQQQQQQQQQQRHYYTYTTTGKGSTGPHDKQQYGGKGTGRFGNKTTPVSSTGKGGPKSDKENNGK